MQNSFIALKALCALAIHPHLPQSLTTSDLFAISMVLPLPECHRDGIIQ